MQQHLSQQYPPPPNGHLIIPGEAVSRLRPLSTIRYRRTERRETAMTPATPLLDRTLAGALSLYRSVRCHFSREHVSSYGQSPY